jgi:hypothetical protein
VVVHNLNFKSIGIDPPEADSPLVVDPNAVLPFAITRKRLQPIAWNGFKICEGFRRMNMVRLPLPYLGNTLKLPAELAAEKPSRSPCHGTTESQLDTTNASSLMQDGIRAGHAGCATLFDRVSYLMPSAAESA